MWKPCQPGSSQSGTLFDYPARQQDLATINQRMSEPNFWDDPESAQRTVMELKKLKATVEPVGDLLERLDDANALSDMLDEDNDAALRKEFDQELRKLATDLDRVERITLLSRPHDANNCFFGIQAGTGGADAQDWAEMMMRMYLRFFERNEFDVEQLSMKDGEEAGIQSANFFVKGPFAYGLLSCEMGVHRMERISPFNAQGKRQTSFASVDVQAEVEDIDIDIDWDKDVREDTYRASGAGGQHVNKTSSAVRLTYLPLNVVVQCQNERSQHKNRAQAQKMLASKLYQIEQAKRDAELAKAYGEKGQIGWGYRIRTYTLQPYRQVKDERTGFKVSDVDAVLDGDLSDFIDAMLRKRARQTK
ncbi:MAG: peptide chain release factor 2 [Phycisphaerales bacterium]|nr:peptide chain release factor 2 [Phycisphaerales bacterium]